MSYETILFEIADGVATITLNRPDSYNALNLQMYVDLASAIKSCSRDSAVRALVLTGAGKGFCSGADLAEMNQLKHSGRTVGDVLREGLNPLILSLRTLEKPVIGALNGVAAGAGASLALACDLRIASEKANFVFAAFVNIGIIPDGGSTFTLAQLVGVSKAMELALLADAKNRLDAQSALQAGIVNRVVPQDDFMTETMTLARKLAAMPTRAIGMTKRAVYRAAERSLVDALEYEAQVQDGAFRTKDHAEGVAAFIEKREPVFTGE